MDVLTFGGDGPACIHARVMVGFASRHVCPKLPQLPVSDSLQPVKRASTHTPTGKGIEEQLGNKTIDHVS
jgi:hypothetical protein